MRLRTLDVISLDSHTLDIRDVDSFKNLDGIVQPVTPPPPDAFVFEGYNDGLGNTGTVLFNTGTESGKILVVES